MFLYYMYNIIIIVFLYFPGAPGLDPVVLVLFIKCSCCRFNLGHAQVVSMSGTTFCLEGGGCDRLGIGTFCTEYDAYRPPYRCVEVFTCQSISHNAVQVSIVQMAKHLSKLIMIQAPNGLSLMLYTANVCIIIMHHCLCVSIYWLLGLPTCWQAT